MELFSAFLNLQPTSRLTLKLGLTGAFLAGLFAFAVPGAGVAAPTSARYLTPQHRAEIEKLITSELQRQLNQTERTEGQSRFLTVKVKFDPTGELLIIDPGKGFLDLTSETITADTEEQMKQLSGTVRDLLHGIVSVTRTQFRFDGKDIYHYFPTEWRPNALKISNHTPVQDTVSGIWPIALVKRFFA